MGDGRAHVVGQTLASAEGSAGALPGGLVQVAGGMRGEGRQVGHHWQVGRAPARVRNCAPSCTRRSGTLKVPFPILRRARPQATISTTLSCAMSRSVTKPLRQVTLPSGLAAPTFGRVVWSAPAPSRKGGPVIRRCRWRRLPAPRPAVQRIPCSAMPCRYSPSVLWLDGLHTKMKLLPVARTALKRGWRA